MQQPKPLTEEQILHLEMFVKSPAWPSFLALIDSYQYEALNALLMEINPAKIHQIQGRFTALNAVKNLPLIRVQMLEEKRKAEEERQKIAEKMANARKPKTNKVKQA